MMDKIKSAAEAYLPQIVWSLGEAYVPQVFGYTPTVPAQPAGICPLSERPFKDAIVVFPTGHTYERRYFVEWTKKHRTDPLTALRIDPSAYARNHEVMRYGGQTPRGPRTPLVTQPDTDPCAFYAAAFLAVCYGLKVGPPLLASLSPLPLDADKSEQFGLCGIYGAVAQGFVTGLESSDRPLRFMMAVMPSLMHAFMRTSEADSIVSAINQGMCEAGIVYLAMQLSHSLLSGDVWRQRLAMLTTAGLTWAGAFWVRDRPDDSFTHGIGCLLSVLGAGFIVGGASCYGRDYQYPVLPHPHSLQGLRRTSAQSLRRAQGLVRGLVRACDRPGGN